MLNPFDDLCYYDLRSTNYIEPFEDDDIPVPRLYNCHCDNCFYGNDPLAMEIIRLRELLPEGT